MEGVFYTAGNKRELMEIVELLHGMGYPLAIKVEKLKSIRTELQNNSLHLWCGREAEALNDAGFEQRKFWELAKAGYEVPWRKETVKENIWRGVQIALTGTESTTQISKVEPGDIYDAVYRALAGVGAPCVDWPAR